jgi:tripartite-type tricarboxylate transporter receptor subunit TctC
MRTVLTLLWLSLLFAPGAFAQDAATNFPNRPIHIIVCVPAGGGVDTVTRIVADGLQKKLGQPVIVENKAGAGGNIGAEAVFNADPDGYTLLAAQPSPLTVNPLLYSKMAFDPARFEPVTIMTTVPNVLLVRPDFPAKTAKEFIAYAKANPGKINYASQGIGTTSHLTAALFEKVTGTTMVHVPFKGTAPALNALIGSHCSDARRSRREGLRIRHLERHRRAAQDAAGDCRQAQQGDQRGAQEPGGGGPLRQDQLARCRPHARRGQGLHREGDAGLGRGGQRGARPAALIKA